MASLSAQSIQGVKSDLTSNRVGIFLKDAVGLSAKSQCSDLTKVQEKYNNWKRNVKLLVSALQAEHQALVKLNDSRAETARQISALSADSPIFDVCGKSSYPDDPNISFASIHEQLFMKKRVMIERYLLHIVNYAIEWERVVNERVIIGLKKVTDLRREMDHYEMKVGSLRNSANSTMSRGKMVDPKVTEKLRRNETKFYDSRQSYDEFSSEFFRLIDEVCINSWKDLHPLVIKMTQFDSTVVTEEYNSFRQLDSVLNKLKSYGERFHLNPQARLKEIQTQSSDILCGQGPSSYAALKPSINNEDLLSMNPKPTIQTISEHATHESTELISFASFGEKDFSNALSLAPTKEFNPILSAAPPPTMEMLTNETGLIPNSSPLLSSPWSLPNTSHNQYQPQSSSTDLLPSNSARNYEGVPNYQSQHQYPPAQFQASYPQQTSSYNPPLEWDNSASSPRRSSGAPGNPFDQM